MKFQMIPLHMINSVNGVYNFQSKQTAYERLRENMQKISVTDPVYLLAEENGFIILDGFTRVNVLKTFYGKETDFHIPAFVLTRHELTYSIHLSIVLKQDLQSSLSFSEKVRAFNLLKREYPQISHNTILQDLELPTDNVYKNVYSALENASLNWHLFFTRHRVPGRRIKTIVQSANLSILEPLLSLDLGINKLEQAVIMLSESASRDNKVINVLIKEFMPSNSENIQPEEFFNKLTEYRYPLMSAYQNKLNNMIKDIKIPHSVRIEYDKEGEWPGIRLTFHIQETSDLTRSEKWVKQNRHIILSFIKERLKL